MEQFQLFYEEAPVYAYFVGGGHTQNPGNVLSKLCIILFSLYLFLHPCRCEEFWSLHIWTFNIFVWFICYAYDV